MTLQRCRQVRHCCSWHKEFQWTYHDGYVFTLALLKLGLIVIYFFREHSTTNQTQYSNRVDCQNQLHNWSGPVQALMIMYNLALIIPHGMIFFMNEGFQRENEETLDDFGKDQKTYNAFLNEWDCGHEIGELMPEEKEDRAQDLFETQGETRAGKLPHKDRPLLKQARMPTALRARFS